MAARILLEKAVFHRDDDAKLMMKLAIATSCDPEAMLENPVEMDPAFLLASAEELLAHAPISRADAMEE